MIKQIDSDKDTKLYLLQDGRIFRNSFTKQSMILDPKNDFHVDCEGSIKCSQNLQEFCQLTSGKIVALKIIKFKYILYRVKNLN